MVLTPFRQTPTIGERPPDASEGVEQVRRRVAPVVQHLVEGEDVVVVAVVGKVGVLDAAEGDGSLSFDQLLRGQNLQGHVKKTGSELHQESTKGRTSERLLIQILKLVKKKKSFIHRSITSIES